MVEGTGRGKFKERLRRDFHPLPTFRVTDDPFLGSQMTAFAAKFRVTDDQFLGPQMTGEPSRSTTESEVVSLAHSLYQEGLPSLQLWELLLNRSVTLRVMEDNQATILVVRKGYSPKLRHITRTRKVNLSGLSEVFRDDSAVLEHCQTDKQAADIFTKALAPQKWGSALRLLGIRTDLSNELKGSQEGAAT